jgi:hypothetical protein
VQTCTSAATRPAGKDKEAIEPRLVCSPWRWPTLEVALAFYRRLGLESNSIIATEMTDEMTGANYKATGLDCEMPEADSGSRG